MDSELDDEMWQDDYPINLDEFLPLAHEAFAEDWNAPGMDAYDDYDRHRPKS